METPEERARRIQRLEMARVQRRADIGTVWPTPDDAGTGVSPIEIGPGRGDLNRFSGFYPSFPTALQMVGRQVSFARLFMSQPWVAAAVMRMLTWSVRVPMKVYRKTGDSMADRVLLQPKDHPLAAAIASPDNRKSQVDLLMDLFGPVLVHGNSVTVVDQGAQNKIQFLAKDWRFCRPIMPFRDSLEGFVFDYDQPQFKDEVSIDQVLHCKWWSPTGPIGTSPLQQLGVTLQIEDAAQRFQRAMFANGARPPSAIMMSEEFLSLDRTERAEIMAAMRGDINALYSGPDNAGRPALLPPGLTWNAVGQTTVEAELINQRKITREEIAGVYLIPPPLMGILDRATYSNIEVQRNMTYTDCLGPPLVMLEQALNAQVARDLLQEEDIAVAFDFSHVLRGDPLKEIEALQAAVASALMTPNEGRGVLNLKQSDEDGMNDFYLPANNLQPVGSPPTMPVGGPGAPVPTQQQGPPPAPDNEQTDLQPPAPDQQRGQKVLHVVSRGW